MRTSPAWGSATGRSLSSSTSGPPRRLKMTLLAVLTDGLSSARLSREHDNSGDPHLMREHFESHILDVLDAYAYASDGKSALRRCSGQAYGTTPHAKPGCGAPRA